MLWVILLLGTKQERPGQPEEKENTMTNTNVKFNKYNVQNTTTGEKVKVVYYQNETKDGRKFINVSGKTCLDRLSKVFGSGVINNSEFISDYVENDRIRIYEDDSNYKVVSELAKFHEERFARSRAKK